MVTGGEKSTKFFHTITLERIKRNRIEMLRKENGTECRWEVEISKKVASYFENLFTSSRPQDCEQIFEGIPRTITEAMKKPN